jgi:RNA polymerase sigma factor (sigma-70 family)
MPSVVPESVLVGTEGDPSPADLYALYREERGPLLWYLRSQGVEEHEAEDAIQAAFVRLLLAKTEVREPRWWLRTVALNEYRRSSPRIPSSRRRAVVVPVSPADLSSQCAATPFSDPAELTEPGLWAHDAIASLPDRQRRVMAAHIEGRTNQQIADDLGVSNASVRQSLRRARRALSERLRTDADDERG